MRRALISLLAAFPLACAPATALASTGRATDGPQGPCATVAGTVVSVDAANHQFVANAYVLPTSAGNHCPITAPPPPILTAPDRGPRAVTPPATTQVMIGVDTNTKIRVNDRAATLADLRPNATFYAVFSGQPTDPITTLVYNAAVSIQAKNPPRHRQLFAFVGTVINVSSSAGTVTVNVSQSLPNSLVPSGSAPLTFAVNRRTLVLGGNAAGGLNGGSVSGVQVGDVVAAGTVGWSDMTLTEVQSLPLRLLIDFPVATSTGGAGLNPGTQTKALRRALSLLGLKTVSKHHKAKSHKKAHARKHSRHA
jgi:hypothetical protein